MATFIICAVLLIIAIFGIKSYCKKLSSGCCGASSSEPEVKRVKVKDKDISHYPYHKRTFVGGMSCEKCAVRVENALNSLDGVFAKVDLIKEQADIYMKQMVEDQTLNEAIEGAGYSPYGMETV